MDRALTEKRIEELRESRMGITRLLASYIKDAKNKPKTFVHASCVGIYPYKYVVHRYSHVCIGILTLLSLNQVSMK
jgi:NAD dependent epimerase/dehydratase family enzyme